MSEKSDTIYYVYCYTNKINSKKYIGKTKNIERRHEQHIKNAKSGRGHSLFHKAINKYGIDLFNLEILYSSILEDDVLEKEIYYVELYKTNVYKYGLDSGYNLTRGGEGRSGYIYSDEKKLLHSQSCQGSNASITEDVVLLIFNDKRKQIDIAQKYGIDQTTVSNIKCGKSWGWLTGKIFCPETRLSNKDIIDIFISDIAITKLSIQYNVSRNTIANIKNRNTHNNITKLHTNNYMISNSKLSKNEIIQIFNSNDKRKSLAAQYGVNKSVIDNIKCGKTFKNIIKDIK